MVLNNQTAADLMMQYGLSYHTLQTSNPGTDLEDIKDGDVLCVPAENTPCTLPVKRSARRTAPLFVFVSAIVQPPFLLSYQVRGKK